VQRSAAARSKVKRKGAYTIQIAAAHTRADAERVARRVAARRPRIVAADVPGKGRWYRVQIGSYETRESARLALVSMSGVHGVVTTAR
jgi:DedD protein